MEDTFNKIATAAVVGAAVALGHFIVQALWPEFIIH
jgi:hypothetical protein